jgi:hypothetical protein
MPLPDDRQQRTVPITGKGVPRTGPLPVEPAVSSEEFTMRDGAGERPTISVPARGRREPEPVVAENAAEVVRKRPAGFGKGGKPVQFTKIVGRPQTSFDGHAVAQDNRADSAIDPDAPVQVGYAKQDRSVQPVYQPNKLSIVLDGVFSVPGLRWLEVLDTRWVRYGVLLFFAGIIGSLVVWRMVDSMSERASVARVDDGETGVVVPMERRVERVREAVEGFLGAGGAGERLRYVYDAERAQPRMARFYGEWKGVDPKVERWEVGTPRDNGVTAWFPVTFVEGGGRRTTIAVMESEEGCTVDWENFVSYGEVSWADFLRDRRAQPEAMRVFLRVVGAEDGVVAVPGFRGFRVRHRGGDEEMTAWVSEGSRVLPVLGEVIAGRPGWVSANAYLSFSEGGPGPAGMRIDDVVRNRWQDSEVECEFPKP